MAETDLPNLLLPLSSRSALLLVCCFHHHRHSLGKPNPFAGGGEELASVGYRYRRWKLNPDDDTDIIVRCEIDGVINNKV